MSGEIVKATHTGTIEIRDITLDCAVLADGTRVISQRGVTKGLGGKRGGSHWLRQKNSSEAVGLPVYISARNLNKFIDADLKKKLKAPIEYAVSGKGGAIAQGVEAAILPQICDVYLKARDAGALLPSQEHIAKSADLLMRGLAHVGVVAMVDEATGYQYERTRNALEEILDKFISTELRKWTKTFPDEFYEHLFRLRGWNYRAMSVARPSYVGTLTNEIVYERLAPGVLEELKKVTPRGTSGRHSQRLFQRLTEDVGHPRLREHLAAVIALMKASTSWDGFYRLLQRSLPKYNETMPLALEEE